MAGISFACIYAFFLWLSKVEGPRIFQRTANFLFWWYVCVAFLVGALGFLISFGGLTLGLWDGKFSSLVLGGIVGGTVGTFVFIILFLFTSIQIIGARLLSTSVEKNETWIWHNGRLIFGFLLIIISLMLTGGL